MSVAPNALELLTRSMPAHRDDARAEQACVACEALTAGDDADAASDGGATNAAEAATDDAATAEAGTVDATAGSDAATDTRDNGAATGGSSGGCALLATGWRGEAATPLLGLATALLVGRRRRR